LSLFAVQYERVFPYDTDRQPPRPIQSHEVEWSDEWESGFDERFLEQVGKSLGFTKKTNLDSFRSSFRTMRPDQLAWFMNLNMNIGYKQVLTKNFYRSGVIRDKESAWRILRYAIDSNCPMLLLILDGCGEEKVFVDTQLSFVTPKGKLRLGNFSFNLSSSLKFNCAYQTSVKVPTFNFKYVLVTGMEGEYIQKVGDATMVQVLTAEGQPREIPFGELWEKWNWSLPEFPKSLPLDLKQLIFYQPGAYVVSYLVDEDFPYMYSKHTDLWKDAKDFLPPKQEEKKKGIIVEEEFKEKPSFKEIEKSDVVFSPSRIEPQKRYNADKPKGVSDPKKTKFEEERDPDDLNWLFDPSIRDLDKIKTNSNSYSTIPKKKK